MLTEFTSEMRCKLKCLKERMMRRGGRRSGLMEAGIWPWKRRTREAGKKWMKGRNKESLRAARWPGGQTFCHEKVHIPFKLWIWFNFPCVLKLFFTRGSIKYSLTLTKLPQWKTKGNVKYVKTFSKTPSKLLSFVHQNAQYWGSC